MKKKDRLEIRLSQTEFEILDRQAKELGLNRSEFIRRTCCSESKEFSIFKEEHVTPGEFCMAKIF